MEWQPIETAPKDGRFIIAHHRLWNPVIRIVRYTKRAWLMIDSEFTVGVDPTHWMPLPAPPESAS